MIIQPALSKLSNPRIEYVALNIGMPGNVVAQQRPNRRRVRPQEPLVGHTPF